MQSELEAPGAGQYGAGQYWSGQRSAAMSHAQQLEAEGLCGMSGVPPFVCA